MGTCSSRPEVMAARNTSYEWYKSAASYSSKKYYEASEYMGPKITAAQSDYGPQLDRAKINYDLMRMYSRGWYNESVTDNTSIKFITEFEKDLPLRNISLTEYERRLKKLVTPAMNDMVPVRVIAECFRDHWAFLDINEEESFTRELMFDSLFLEESEDENTPLDDRRASVPMLMLLGLLYCRSNRQQRAEKFYELVEIQLTDQLSVNDVEFRQYIPFLYEISYKFMFRLYTRHRDQTPGEGGQPQRCPEVDIMEHVPNSFEVDEQVKKSFVKIFINELFKTKSVMKRGALVKKVTE